MRVAVWVVEEIGGTASEKTGSKSETNDDGGADNDDGGADTSTRACSRRRREGVPLRWQHVGVT